jgi:RNA polymerase sigma factor for flagellar operon FliA
MTTLAPPFRTTGPIPVHLLQPQTVQQAPTPVQPRRTVPRKARDRLIAEHVELARRISLRLARRYANWVGRDDVVAAGMLGLAEAAERYDDSRGEPFAAFAEKRIRGAVLDELRRGDIMPRRVRQMARKVSTAQRELERTHGCAPTDEQMAQALGVSLEEYRTELAPLTSVSMHSLEPDEERHVPSREASPASEAERREVMARVEAALEHLDPRDAMILALHYRDDLPYGKIAETLGVTTSRVCQLHGRAIARLRGYVDVPR